MRTTSALACLFLATAQSHGQCGEPESVHSLVLKLGSTDFRQREAAAKALRQRPEAEAALRGAMDSGSLEVRRRAAAILSFIRRTKLEAAVREGRADEVAELVGHWPAGEDEEFLWQNLRQFAATIMEVSRKRGGRIGLRSRPGEGETITPLMAELWGDRPQFAMRAERIQSVGRCPLNGTSFLRAGQIDLAPGQQLTGFAVMATAGSVRLSNGDGRYAIFAGGDVEAHGDAVHALIVAGGDIKLDGRFHRCLIVSKGKATCIGSVPNSCVISGRAVGFGEKKEALEANRVVENDSNPLGFIRWADAPKDKDGGKTPAKGGEKKQ